MKVIKITEVTKKPAIEPLFVGSVTSQSIVDTGLSKKFILRLVHFDQGARNKFHSHSIEQILIVTEGKGIVATDKAEFTVGLGDVIFIPAGEKHWHGATKDSCFSHLYVLSPDSKTTQLED